MMEVFYQLIEKGICFKGIKTDLLVQRKPAWKGLINFFLQNCEPEYVVIGGLINRFFLNTKVIG